MKNSFWSDAARCGAYVGLLLAVSSVLETGMALSGKLGVYALLAFEWLAAVALHFYLLYRFTRQRSALSSADDGFSFGQGYGYQLAVSVPAGLILGVANYIFVHLVLGYDRYVEKITEVMEQLAGMGGNSAPMAAVIKQLNDMPEPSLFSTIWGGVWSSLLFSLFFGLIIAGVLARSPKPFADNDADHE